MYVCVYVFIFLLALNIRQEKKSFGTLTPTVCDFFFKITFLMLGSSMQILIPGYNCTSLLESKVKGIN